MRNPFKNYFKLRRFRKNLYTGLPVIVSSNNLIGQGVIVSKIDRKESRVLVHGILEIKKLSNCYLFPADYYSKSVQ